MATTVCGCGENLEVLDDGRLCVKHDDSLVDGPDGLALPVMQVYDNDSDVDNSNVDINNTTTLISGTMNVNITNPSTSRSMRVQVVEQSTPIFVMDSTDQVRVQHRRIVNGGPQATSTVAYHGELADDRREGQRHTVIYYIVVAPGDSLGISFNVIATKTSGSGASYKDESASSIAVWGILI